MRGGAATPAARAVLRSAAAEPKVFREPLSPELVLVSPQLRMMALDGLPERPWEAFLHTASDTPPTPIAAGSLVAELAVGPLDDLADSTTESTSRRGRNLALVTVALIVGFVAGQFIRQPTRPSFLPSSGGSPAASPPAPAKQPTRETSSPGQGAVGPATTLAGGLAVPRGGYVFSRSGRFQIAPDLRTVRMFHARVKCARNVVIPAMSLRGGSRFAYRGQIRASNKRGVQLEVAGRFLDSSRVRGFVRARSAGCDSGKVRFLARLS